MFAVGAARLEVRRGAAIDLTRSGLTRLGAVILSGQSKLVSRFVEGGSVVFYAAGDARMETVSLGL